MNIDLHPFTYLPFKGTKVKTPELLWLSRTWGAPPSTETKDAFLTRFAYVNAESDSFADLEVNPSDQITLLGEIYGGIGRGGNGGGVRCGNIDFFQTKGIGTNALIGRDSDLLKTNGIFSIHEAIFELLNSKTLSAALPHGCIEVYGLIYVGDITHQNKHLDIKLPRCLLVRERVVRPAHMMHAADFEAGETNSQKFPAEVTRLRSTIKSISKNHKLDEIIRTFIARSAAQLSCGKILGICHGAMSPSNIALDGRWLDMTNSAIIPPNYNYSVSDDTAPFFSETIQFESCVLVEFLHNIEKYSGIILDRLRYDEMLSDACRINERRYLLKLLGFEVTLERCRNVFSFIDPMVESYKRFLNDRLTTKSPNSSKLKQKDVRLEYINAFYSSQDLPDLDSGCTAQKNAITDLCLAQKRSHEDTDRVVYSLFESRLKALRTVILSEAISRENIHNSIHHYFGVLHWHDFKPNIQGFVDDIETFSKTIFGHFDLAGRTYIYRDRRVSIYFDHFKKTYIIFSAKENIELICHSPKDLLTQLSITVAHDFTIFGINVKPYLEALLEELVDP